MTSIAIQPIDKEDLRVEIEPNVCYFGLKGEQKGQKSPEVFGIANEDRRKHVYILGKTGMGKTTLLQNMVLQDIYNGFGVCFIDPHGDSSEYIIDRIPAHRQNDVIYLNPADIDFPMGLNILEPQNNEQPFLIASGLMAVFNKIWAGLWSSRMEYILNNTLLTLLETPGNTLLGVVKLLTDDDYREKVVAKVSDPMLRNFWVNEFAKFNARYRQEAISPILNKVGQFLSNELIRNLVGQKTSTINFRQIMDEQKIFIVNLSKGRLGEDNSNLLGSLVVAKLQIAAMSRVDIAEKNRKDFFVFVDEFQNFTTDSFAGILSEARKYRLNLVLAHQYISQLTETGSLKVKNAIFGNVGTIISFRVGSSDGESLSKEYSGVFNSNDLMRLDRTEIVLKLALGGRISEPFLARTLPPIFEKLNGHSGRVINISRSKNTKSREMVSGEIEAWLKGKKPSSTDSSKNKPDSSKEEKSKKDKKNSSFNVLEMKSKGQTDSRLDIRKRIDAIRQRGLLQTPKLDEKDKAVDLPEIDELFELPEREGY